MVLKTKSYIEKIKLCISLSNYRIFDRVFEEEEEHYLKKRKRLFK